LFFQELQEGVVGDSDIKNKNILETFNEIYDFEFENQNGTEGHHNRDSEDFSEDDYEHEEYPDYAVSVQNGLSSCKCLPSCSSIQYDAEISQTKLNVVKHYKATSMFEEEDEE
jgi:hypothetical protein